ncbi:Lead, cadmium, zinc and mercury transporting ATPase [Alkalibacterium sp. AK22]|uniref:heavy metal translocating P-type ATPase n=1 Tax=Alkalibacterium sp. AK22 TaxID=1229520 RepID=UPI00045262BE|nr:heavy metal translocating P-type ATPase [Alkalibacterium sp. AK22]EXJ23192.1 Lead, cadmium, zinc and mercury transporting ATPase [Alkalibacterium sp. AK22]
MSALQKIFKNNTPMLLTVISGFLIMIGSLFTIFDQQPLDAVIFVSSFLIGGYYQAREGVTDFIRKRELNVDILMVLAAVGASIIGFWLEGALLIFIFSLSGSLEIYTTNKSTDAIAKLMQLAPAEAWRIKADGSTEVVAASELSVGDTVLVPKGGAVPIDGKLLSDYALMDESAISGESIPVNKEKNEEVIGGTLNLNNPIKIEVTRVHSDTLFSKIIRLVEEAQSTPSKTATLIHSIETTYVKVVLLFVPLMMLIFYYVLNWGFTESFYRGMVLLTVASPCALMASASPATLSAISNGAKKGVLYKGGSFLENLNRVDAVAFDKTGTLTVGKPSVTDVLYKNECEKELIQSVLISMERTSSHPLAKAVVDYFSKNMQQLTVAFDTISEVEGKGIEGFAQKHHWKIGKKAFVLTDESDPLAIRALKKQDEGKTVLYVSKDGQLQAVIALSDQPAPAAKGLIDYFKTQGIYTIMITGDNEATGQSIAEQLGMDEVRANCLPDKKAELIIELKERFETIVMVGDGINDAPALANASIGIAMGAGTDLAMETADIILVKNELDQLAYSHRLSKKLNRIILQNIVFSISVILVLITVNVLQLINLPLGVLGHEGSTILVILNGLRLLRTGSKPKAEQANNFY